MQHRYQQWIAARVPTDPTGLCQDITRQMVEQFSELTRVRGHYQWTGSTERPWPHWWCVTPSGAIVDPTAAQWPDGGLGQYCPHEEGSPEPTGKCPNCGGYCYESRAVCSDRCAQEYTAYLMEGWKTGYDNRSILDR